MFRVALLIGLSVLLAACSGLVGRSQPATPLIKPPASATEAVGIARDLAQRGRWSDAIALLETATPRFADDPSVADELSRLRAQWERERLILEDELLVGDAESQRDRIALLERYSLAEPDNLIVASRRLYWKEVLSGKLEPLMACGERHAVSEPVLARRCFELAAAFPATEQIEQRLARVDEQLRQNEQIAAERRRVNEEKERQARAKVLLDNAKRSIEGGHYRRALDTLEKVAKLQPNNREVAGLQAEALSMLGPQVEALVKLGDHLYLDEQLEAAVATWQAALSLKPDDEDILARIERAKNVLDRLDALRRQQQPPVIEE